MNSSPDLLMHWQPLRLRCAPAVLRLMLWVAGLFWLSCQNLQAQLIPPPPAELSPDVRLDEASNATRSHLERTKAFITAGQFEEAVETLRTVMEAEGDRVLELAQPGDREPLFRRYVTVRHYCQMRLGELARVAPEALTIYRRRVDPLAQRWYEQAAAQQDISLLERLAEQLLMSSYGDDALMRLGEWALERGQFGQARGYWERISPSLRLPHDDADVGWRAGTPLWFTARGAGDQQWQELLEVLGNAPQQQLDWLVYPDTDLGLPEVRARLVLTSILEGSAERAAIELELLRRMYPDAEGDWAGQRRKYVELLQDMLDQSQQWPAVDQQSQWTTFASAASRNAALSSPLIVEGRTLWRVPLEQLSAGDDLLGSRGRIAETDEELLSYHPVLWKDLVLVAQPGIVQALRSDSGEPAFAGGEVPGAIFEAPRSLDVPTQQRTGVPRYTLTVHDGKVFARLGSVITGPHRASDLLASQQGYIVGLDLEAQGKMLPGFPLRPESTEWAFEGSPLTDGSFLYTAMRRREQVLAQSYVACFDLQTGQLRWRRLIAAADTPGHGEADEVTHQLLTLDGPTIYYNTNLGAVAALDKEDGELRWVIQYPRSSFRSGDPEETDFQFLRDLNPCVVYKSVVVVAPTDCDRIFALDAQTGHLLWSTDGDRALDAVHVLGISGDRLILSGDYLYWFDVYSGRSRGQFPAPARTLVGHQAPSPRGFGRGLLRDEHIYWPTRQAIYIFDRRTIYQNGFWQPIPLGIMPLEPRGLTGGNLVLAGDRLLIATASQLVALGSGGAPLLPLPRVD